MHAALALATVLLTPGGAAGGAPPPCIETKLTASDTAREQHFGGAVNIDGDVAVVGADGNGQYESYPGAAYVFRRVGSAWVQEQKLVASDSAEGDGFGTAVAVDGSTIMVASHNFSGSYGAVYVFEWEGTLWVQRQKLVAPDPNPGGHFGWSVAVDGDIAAIGQYGDEFSGADAAGAVCVFRRTGTLWILEQKLIPHDSVPQGYDFFGVSVAVNGNLIVGGARLMDEGRGAAYVFRWNGTTWVEEQKLTRAQSEQHGSFGQSVAVWGATTLVGSPDNGAPNYGPGTVSVFRHNGFMWVESQTLTAADGGPGDHFGGSVSLHGNRALVQAAGIPDPGTPFGVAYVYEFGGEEWVEKRRLTSRPDVGQYGGFGAVALANRYAVVGAAGDDDACPTDPYCNSGAAYIFDINLCLNPIPAVSTWGLAVIGLSLGGIGTLLIRKRLAPQRKGCARIAAPKKP